MHAEIAGDFTPERPTIPSEISAELDAQFDILFASLTPDQDYRTHNGGTLYVSERDEQLIHRYTAATHIAQLLSNRETAPLATEYVIHRYTDGSLPAFAIYAYQSILTRISEVSQDDTAIEFMHFMDTLATQEDLDETETDRAKLRLLELAYTTTENRGLTGQDFTEKEEEDIEQALAHEYKVLLDALERYGSHMADTAITALQDAYDRFQEAQDSRGLRKDARLLRQMIDPYGLARRIKTGVFATREGNILASRLHDTLLFNEIYTYELPELRSITLSCLFMSRSANDRAAALCDKRLLLQDMSLEEMQTCIEKRTPITEVGLVTLEAKYDLMLYRKVRESIADLQYAYVHGLFLTDTGLETAQTRLLAYGVDVLSLQIIPATTE